MKKLALVFLMAGGLARHTASAQVKVNLDVNIGSQPLWGPTGYDHADYKGRRDQGPVRDSHDEKYWQIKGHPDHDKWRPSQ